MHKHTHTHTHTPEVQGVQGVGIEGALGEEEELGPNALRFPSSLESDAQKTRQVNVM